jgi:hypothetical protein
MPAQFRIDQATPGIGVAGRARHDLIVGEDITLVATDPAPGPGVSFSWEILDKVGTAAVLSSTTGQSVTISGAALATAPYAFVVRLTTNDNGVITRQERAFSARSATHGLRVPLFGESAPAGSTLATNYPDRSIDNALYVNRAGTGVTEQNWRGWSEWAWELVAAMEALPTDPAVGGDLSGTISNATVEAIQGVAVSATPPSDGEVLVYDSVATAWVPDTVAAGGGASSEFIFQPGGTPGDNIYDTWTTLHAAVAAYAGVRRVVIDTSLGAATVSAGSWDIDGWILRGTKDVFPTPTLTVPDGASLTFTNWAKIEHLELMCSSALSAAAITVTTFAGQKFVVGEGGRINTLHAGAAGIRVDGGFIEVIVETGGQLSQRAVNVINWGMFYLTIRGLFGSLDPAAISGDAGAFAVFQLRTATPGYLPTFTGFLGSTLLSRSALLQYLHRVNKEFMIDDQQLGTTEKHVGSVYLVEGSAIDFESRAMIGGSAPGEVAELRLRRFTGGGLLCTFSRTGTLDSVWPSTTPVVPATDWYDVYLVAGDPAHTAICKGVRLVMDPSIQNGV